MSRRTLASLKLTPIGIFVAGVLASVLGVLALGSAPALAATATGNVYRSQFEVVGAGTGHFAGALAFNTSGDVYVFDPENKIIYEFNAAGTQVLAEIDGSKTTAGSSFYTEGMAFNASDDTLYVAGGERGVVYEFNAAGALLAEVNGDETAAGSFYATAVAFNASGDLYVEDYTHEVVDEFEPSGGKGDYRLIREFSGKETKAGSFAPDGIAVNASSGDVYVLDSVHGVVDEFNSTGTEVLAEINGSETPQSSASSVRPTEVAVSPSGEVYTSNYIENYGGESVEEYAVVNRFSSTGKYLSQFGAATTPQGSFGYPYGLAVNTSEEVYLSTASTGVVDIFSKPVPIPVVTTGAPVEVQQTTATLTGSIEPVAGLETSCEFIVYGAPYSTVPCSPTGPFSSFNEVRAEITGLQRETVYGYRLEGTTANGPSVGEEQRLTTLSKVVQPPTASIKPVAPIAQNSATFNGEVDPNEAATSYRFEYSTDGESWIALKEESAGEGTSEAPVTQTATGLTGNTTYHVRLIAESSCEHGVTGCGSSTSAEETFTTLAGPPKVSGASATDITAADATLRATIYPENQPATTYRFEYGPTAAYGTKAPLGEGHIGNAPSPVSQAITGLAPDTTYHFRVVASNGVGSPVATADQTFTTYSRARASAGCPNEQVRAESDVNPETGVPFSIGLPECRAYEAVSPTLKNGAPISSAASTGLSSGSSVARVGPEGSTVLIRSSGIWPGGEQPANNDLLDTLATEGVQYRITRGESGWSFRPEDPPNLRKFKNILLSYPADMSTNGIWAGAGNASTEGQINIRSGPNLYLLEPGGALAKVGPSVPLADQDQTSRGGANSTQGDGGDGGVYAVGGSADLSRVLFDVQPYRWPFDQTRQSFNVEISSLYEYVGTGHSGEGNDVPTLVGVDNAGTLISQCGTEAAGHEGYGAERSEGSVGPEARSISAGGSTVLFLAKGAGSTECTGGVAPAETELFARIGQPGAGIAVGKAVTVNVAGTIGCATSDSCNVTKAITYQGASTNGSKVFFTSEQPLVAGDTDGTSNLYECVLPGDSGTALARTAAVNPCPDLVRMSLPVSGAGAEVQSVVATSADGSRVYFVAKGLLSGENAEHNDPASGQDNLYMWEGPSSSHPQGRTVFVATLSAPLKLGEAQTTPNGEQLVFTGSADLTEDDTSTVSQVFLYEAQRETLTRVSKGQDGYNEDGNTTTDPAYISTDGEFSSAEYNVAEGRSVISEDGSTVVFQSSDALTPQVHGGTRNVYLWHGGNVYLISDGTPAGNKAGEATNGALEAGLVGIDASGQNVFFTTEAKLVGQDGDELSDLYDARVDGGFPAPKVDECIGEACQGALSPSLGPAPPGSLSPSAQGNLPPRPLVQSTTPVTPTVKILKTQVKAGMLVVTVKTSVKGDMRISGSGLVTTIEKGVAAGTHQIGVKLTKAGKNAKAHRKKIELRAGLTAGKQSAAKTISVKL